MKRSGFNIIWVSFVAAVLAALVIELAAPGPVVAYLVIYGLGAAALFFLLGTDLKNPRVGDELRHVGFRRRPDE